MRRLRRLLDALGPAGIAGLGVLFFCVPFYFSALAPAQRELERRELAQRSAGKASPVQVENAGNDPSAELERFYSRFPPVERLGAEMQALYAHARASKLQLMQGEYRLESQSAGSLAAYRVTLPVRGNYAQLRQFVGRVLTHMPAASLDAVRFERKKAPDPQIEAQLRLTIYLRKGT
jgi:hypothetical protein